MTNDALIAAYCLRTGSTLLSADQDYNDLRGTQALRDLRFLDWTKLQHHHSRRSTRSSSERFRRSSIATMKTASMCGTSMTDNFVALRSID